MNILHIPPYAPPIEGGSERFCFNLCKKLMKMGHNTRVFTSRNDRTKFDIIEGVPCYFYKNYWQMLGLNPLSFIYRDLSHGVDWADIVHVHSYIYFLGNQVALYRKIRKFPFVLHLHGGTSPITSDVYGLKASIVKRIYDVTVGKWEIHSADFIMASSKDDMRNAINIFGADRDKIVHIPNSIYVDDFYSAPQNPPIVTFLARLTQLKGCYHIPAIIRRVSKAHRDATFWIVGEGYVEEFLRKELKDLPIIFWGMVPHTQVPDIFARSSISFLPSYTESSPLALLESMASQVPVVASNTGGIPEIVLDGVTGYVTPVADPKAMADKIIYLLDNPDVRKRMGQVGRKIVEEKYSWKSTTEKILNVYKSLI